MTILHVQAQLSSEALIQAIEQLPQPEFTWFADQVQALRLQRVAPFLQKNETELLLSINQGIPTDLQQRYDVLVTKRQDETLTSNEYEELLDLINQVEQYDVRRIEQLVALAQIRKCSLSQLMHDLGIETS